MQERDEKVRGHPLCKSIKCDPENWLGNMDFKENPLCVHSPSQKFCCQSSILHSWPHFLWFTSAAIMIGLCTCFMGMLWFVRKLIRLTSSSRKSCFPGFFLISISLRTLYRMHSSSFLLQHLVPIVCLNNYKLFTSHCRIFFSLSLFLCSIIFVTPTGCESWRLLCCIHSSSSSQFGFDLQCIVMTNCI